MNFHQLRWDQPLWALGFSLVLLAILALVWLAQWRKRSLAHLGTSGLGAAMAEHVSPGRRLIKAALFVVSLSLIVGALMRPKYGVREAAVKNAGIDVAIALDVSRSMKVKDIVPDRLGGASLEISSMLQKLHGGRVALIPFAGIAYIQSPLTSDFEVIRTYLSQLNPAEMPVPGTSVARALALAAEALTSQNAQSKQKAEGDSVQQFRGSENKAIVLFTDGEDHEGEIDVVTERLSEEGIRVYTVGVGSGAGNVVPILTEDGSEIGYMKGADGKTPLISGLNESLLKDIAEKTGGAYFHYANRSIVDSIVVELDKLEKREYEGRFSKIGEDRFQVLLFPAILLLLLEWFVGERKRKAARAAAVALAAFFVIPPPVAEATSDWTFKSDADVDEGNRLADEGQFESAHAAFQRAVASIPENPILHYDIGRAHLLAGNYEAASESLGRALKSPPKEHEADMHFAYGLATARWGEALESNEQTQGLATEKWNLAVKSFEEVLARRPGNVDAMRDLELALLRVDPPCKVRDKENEPNEQAKDAKPVEMKENTQSDLLEGEVSFLLCPDDTEWFGTMLTAGDKLTATLELEASEEDDVASDAEGQRSGPVLEVFAGDGKTLLGTTSPGSTEAGAADTVALPAAPADGPVFFRIAADAADASREFRGALKLGARPLCSRREDDQEDNDVPGASKPLEQGQPLTLRMCEADPDWFSISLAEGESLFVFASATGDHVEGFDLSVTAPDGTPLVRAAAHEKFRVATLLEPGPGPYLIRVDGGPGVDTPYQLSAKILPPCPAGNDPMEPNDSAAAARDIDELAQAAPSMPAVAGQPGVPGAAPPGGAENAPITALLRICPADNDWFKVAVKPEEPRIATVLFDHGKGDLDLESYDTTGATRLSESRTSAPERHAEGVGLEAKDEEATYLLRVAGADEIAQNFYVLQLLTPPKPGEGEANDQSQDDKQQSKPEQEKDKDKQDKQKPPESKSEQEKPPEQAKADPVQDALERMDKNERNLEAEEAMKKSPLRNFRPQKDW